MDVKKVCRRMRQGVPSLVAAIALMSVCGESAVADAADTSISNNTIRIMLLGDSITHGSHSSTGNGYRAPLWNALTNLGYRVDFVGTQTDSYGRFDPTLGDPDHEGISGITIAGTLKRIDGVFDKCGPVDCVLMLLGTNESLLGERVFRNEATNSLVRLLDRIYARSPSAEVVVATLMPRWTEPKVGNVSANWKYAAITNVFNPAVPGIVACQRAKGQHAHMLDMHAALRFDQLADEVHPNDSGYASMAKFWLGAVTNIFPRPAFTIAERGKTAEYSIVVPEKASPSQKYAAEELRDFTEKATGVRLPIVTDAKPIPAKAIVLGDADAMNRVPPDTDGFRLKVDGSRLYIIGSAERGTLYGVYEFLERFVGCRWYASWHTVVPKRERIEVPSNLDEAQTPAFAMREPYWFDVTQNQEFAARLRVNSRSWKSLDEKYGGNPYRFGGGLGSCHTFNSLLPAKEYFDEHPEYFSMINGKRVRELTQPCLTNPDVLRIITSNVLERIRKDPGAKFYGVSQEDNNHYCQCPNCKAIDDEEGSPSGTNVRFVNAVAEAVEKEFPDVLIETLAYSYTQKAPKKTKLRHNVVPCLCAISCDFARPIYESQYEENISFRKDIEDWGRQTDFLFVWDYTTDFAHYPLPWANVYSLQGNMRFFRRNNVKAIFALGAWQGRHADFGELKAWLLAKWMWNPDLPMKPLLDDFFAGYYGKGAPFVREYFEKLHRIQREYSSSPDHPLRVFDSEALPSLTGEFLAEASELWRKAADAVKDDPATSYNVRMGAFSVDYVRMERGCKLLNLSRSDAGILSTEETQALARSLVARLDEAKDIRIAESPRQNVKQCWRDVANGFNRPPRADRGELEERFLGIMNPGTWGKFVDDPKADDGKALKLFNTHYTWCVQFPISRIAFEPGAKYKLRLRVRVDSPRYGMAFSAGIYSTDTNKGAGSANFTTRQTPNEYAWYDILTWTPCAGEILWIAPGTFGDDGKSSVNGVYIDKVEFIKQ